MKKCVLCLLTTQILLVSVFSQNINQRRASSIGRGVNLSWLECYWTGSKAEGYSDYLKLEDLPTKKKDLALMHELGFTVLRLPVCFDVWASRKPPFAIFKSQYLAVIDSFIHWTSEYKMKLIIDYHNGQLHESNARSETHRICEIWKQIAALYDYADKDNVFFEIYNEPNDISAATWHQSADSIVKAIRQLEKKRTLIVGAGNYNGLAELMQFRPLRDQNIIYTFHFYDPFLFTHQGAKWVGNGVSTIHVPFPYSASQMPTMDDKAKGTFGESIYIAYAQEGNVLAINHKLNLVKAWSVKHKVPVFCGEWGSYSEFADADSRCKYTSAVHLSLSHLHIPYTYWEWDQGFSIFDGANGAEHISPCMKSALYLKN
jgi:endoglucanase